MRILLLALLGLTVSTARSTDLKVTVNGVAAPQGQVLIGVFTNSSNFRVQPQEGSAMIPISRPGSVSHVVSGLRPGHYAIVAFWDKNKNGVLDTGAFGRPTEPFVFSNNPSTRFGPPKFQDCAIAIGEGGGRLVMNLGL